MRISSTMYVMPFAKAISMQLRGMGEFTRCVQSPPSNCITWRSKRRSQSSRASAFRYALKQMPLKKHAFV